MYKSIADEHFKKRKVKVRANSLPWVDRNIRKMMNWKFKLFEKCDDAEKTSPQRQEYGKVKNLVNKSLKEAKTNYWRKSLKEYPHQRTSGKHSIKQLTIKSGER